MKKIIIGISAADGVKLGVRLLEMLQSEQSVETHLVISEKAELNLQLECGMTVDEVLRLADHYYEYHNTAACISSGSFETDGMIIAPCSMKTLSSIANGFSDNLLARCADVCLKERRKLILLARETPLSLIHLRNMCTATEAGAIILPPVLTFYNSPKSIDDQMNHIIFKALMQLAVKPKGFMPWTGFDITED